MDNRANRGCAKTQVLGQILKLFFGIAKFRVVWLDEFGGSGLERILSRDAIDPALLGELFVAGEIEANE